MLETLRQINAFMEIEEGKYAELGVPVPYHVRETLRIIRQQT